MIKHLFFLLFLCIAGASFGQTSDIASTEADVAAIPRMPESTVYGILTVETFFGPPGYGEDPENDEKEEHLILVLEEEPAGETPKMQLVYSGEADITPLIGKTVRVKGILFSGHTGHHNTDILIDVSTLEAAE